MTINPRSYLINHGCYVTYFTIYPQIKCIKRPNHILLLSFKEISKRDKKTSNQIDINVQIFNHRVCLSHRSILPGFAKICASFLSLRDLLLFFGTEKTLNSNVCIYILWERKFRLLCCNRRWRHLLNTSQL